MQSSSFINSLTIVPSSKSYPQGLIASAGKDTIIDVRQPGRAPDQNAERLLVGHAHNVCALDATADGTTLVSGGWDKQARIWNIEKGDTAVELKGHEASVWAVLSYDRDTIITGRYTALLWKKKMPCHGYRHMRTSLIRPRVRHEETADSPARLR